MSFADLDINKMKCIGNVADILEPNPYTQEDSITAMDEPPKAIVGEERDEVDGQTILSFASVEEMHQYDARKESESQQFTLPLSPSPCPSPTSSIPLQSEVPTSNFFQSVGIPSTSMETAGEVKELAEQEETYLKDEIVDKEEVKKEELSAITQEEQPKPVIGLKSESKLDVISAEFAQYAVSAISIPSLELTGSDSKTSEEIPSTSRKRKRSERVPAELPSTSKADVEDFYEKEEYQEDYGTFISISVFHYT